MSAQREIRDFPAFPAAIAGVMRATFHQVGVIRARSKMPIAFSKSATRARDAVEPAWWCSFSCARPSDQ
jgi:hypothetical protein